MENEILDNISLQETVNSQEYNYPLSFEFKIGTLANDFTARDASGVTIAYVRQKIMKLKGAITTALSGKKRNLFLQFVIRDNLVNCGHRSGYLPVGQHNEADYNPTSQNQE